MDTRTAFSFMDLIILGGGIYLLYGWYLLMYKNEIKAGVLVPKDNYKKCKDMEGYKKMVGPKLLIFGIVCVTCGGIQLYQDYVQTLPPYLYWAAFALFFAAMIWFTVASRRAQKEFF